ncbi:GntR family transcriptional regulator [Clostridium beijerinckii]|uniref:GntR family transcriptional regulator n=1 Tax=Clostridium beijerinckii TaxID=1520 RepID=A0AAX0B8F8_CLOBE|nr:GntR family transcriptional regulator [Clostridium beijerinckii]NRT90744.1 GntR family transcriptional regulator [Clostridium beijerinckii]NYC70268.1 GntR family transcriptional regulator [Clostridium beijerinckii]
MLIQDNIIPLYQQLADIIRNSITSGELKYGDKIPTEVELSEKYNVSRITVRAAINELVESGFLIKKQGKGTFVSKPKVQRKIEYLSSFTAACEASGLKVTNEIIKREIVEPEIEDIRDLELDDDDKLIYIQRVRFAGGEPLMLENNYFSFKRFNFLLTEDLNGSLYELLRNKYDINPSGSPNSGKDHTTIEIAKAMDEEAGLLMVQKGEPLFYIKTVIYDDKNRPVHIGKQYVIGERYKFVIS